MARPVPIRSRRRRVRAALSPGGRRRGARPSIVAAVAVVAFARSLGNGFTYDEGLVIVGRSGSCSRGSFGTLLSTDYFGASLEGTWRPFCTLTYMLDALVSFHPAVFKARQPPRGTSAPPGC